MIIPAILTQNIEEVQQKLDALFGIAPWVQIDFMDGEFVDNDSINVTDISLLETSLQLEAHLMVKAPEFYFEDLERVGFERVIFHYEAVDDCREVCELMKAYSFERGIAINPETEPEEIEPFVDEIDLVLILGVNPGFGGQDFIPETLQKIKKTKELYPTKYISVDGGVDEKNIKQIIEHGADMVAVGSGLFKEENIAAQYVKLAQLYEQGMARRQQDFEMEG
jgi:ribulose-phosphate 3-epimerase